MVGDFSKTEIEEGLDSYDPEQRHFPNLALGNASRDLTARDVLLILKWKLGRIKKDNHLTVSIGSLRRINRAVRLAPERQLEAIKNLEKIPGIGLATATAILTLCHPRLFTIIDQRVLSVLELEPPRLKGRRPPRYRAEDWKSAEYLKYYLPRMIEIAKEMNSDLRTADKALWGISVNRDIDKIIRSS